jgi:L-amino acid N-acyltransferase YncA
MTETNRDILVRSVEDADVEAVAEIYNYYIENTVITFEEEKVSPSEIHCRVQDIRSCSFPWLVAEQAGAIAGYAYAGRWKGRYAYRFCVEVTVYVRPGLEGRGIGTCLYRELLPRLREQGIHTAIGVIALPNEPSVALHEKFGFKKKSHFTEVGFKFNRWIDVGDWQCIL